MEDQFLEKEGVFLLLDLLEVSAVWDREITTVYTGLQLFKTFDT